MLPWNLVFDNANDAERQVNVFVLAKSSNERNDCDSSKRMTWINAVRNLIHQTCENSAPIANAAQKNGFERLEANTQMQTLVLSYTK